MTPEMQAHIQILRHKARDGTLSLSEMREAIRLLREDRIGAAQASEKSRGKRAEKAAKAAPASEADLLAELEMLGKGGLPS